jgi:hypothetical protein
MEEYISLVANFVGNFILLTLFIIPSAIAIILKYSLLL